MKKFFLIAMFILFSNVCLASETLSLKEIFAKIPDIKNGVYYSIVDHGLNYSAQVEVLNYKGFNFNLGTAGDQDSTDWKAIASIAYDIGKLEDIGINVPILKHVGFEPYVVFGAGRINFKEMGESETDWGVGANILKINF